MRLNHDDTSIEVQAIHTVPWLVGTTTLLNGAHRSFIVTFLKCVSTRGHGSGGHTGEGRRCSQCYRTFQDKVGLGGSVSAEEDQVGGDLSHR